MSWSFQASALKGIKTLTALITFLANQLFALFRAARYYEPIANLTYGTTVQPNGSRSGIQRIEVTDSTAFTVLNPTLPKEGVSLTLDFINSAAGTIGAVTFGSEYKLDGAFVKPTIDNHVVYTFYRAKDNVWRETSRSRVASTNPTAGFTVSKSALVATFTDTSTAVSPATITSWSWNFGDSATSASQNPSHTYGAAGTYTVVLSVIDTNGSTDDFTLQVAVTLNVAPTASFTVTKTLLHCQFTDTSTDSDGSVTAWDWDFGDLSIHNTSQNPIHNYVSAGTYTVVLIVTDNLGATDTVSHNVTVVSAGTNPPNASFRVGKTNLTVRVTDTSTDDGTITTWNYNWGDLTTHATTQNPSHTYASAGTYTITQTVTDNDSLTDTATQSVTVSASSSIGIPFGAFNIFSGTASLRPNTSSFNLDLDSVSDVQIEARIDFAHRVGLGLILAMTGGARANYLTNGVFDRTKWSAKQQTFNTSAIIAKVVGGVANGSVLCASVMDEPGNDGGPGNEANAWGPAGTMSKATATPQQLWGITLGAPASVSTGPTTIAITGVGLQTALKAGTLLTFTPGTGKTVILAQDEAAGATALHVTRVPVAMATDDVSFSNAVDNMCQETKNIFGRTVPVGVWMDYSVFATQTFRICDFTMSQYRWAKSRGDVNTYISNALAMAARDGIAMCFAINVLDGGIPVGPASGCTSSTFWVCGADTGGLGSYCPNCAMTPTQVEDFGKALGAAGCGLVMWKYRDAFFANAANKTAFANIATHLATLPTVSWFRP